MAKMCFPNVVKYNDKLYEANTSFIVKEADVNELRKAGGWLIEEKPPKVLATTRVKNNKEAKL